MEVRESVERSIERISTLLSETVDLAALRKLGETADPLDQPETTTPVISKTSLRPGEENTASEVKIGVAMDAAFHFYYQDNLDFLEQLGARLVYFSPLTDTTLPEGLSGLYLGGGYPELHGDRLASNQSLKKALRQCSSAGMPIYAECGGLIYLARSLRWEDKTYSMAGIFDVEITMARKLSALGYYTAVTRRASLLGPEEMALTGHIYRWSRFLTEPDEEAWLFNLEKEGQSGFDGFSIGNTVGAYLHVHFAGCPQVARNFVQACRDSQTERVQRKRLDGSVA